MYQDLRYGGGIVECDYANEPRTLGRIRKWNLVCSCPACSGESYKSKGWRKRKNKRMRDEC